MVQATSADVSGFSSDAAPVTPFDLPLRILRIVQLVLAVLVLGLTGAVVNANRTYYDAFDDVIYHFSVGEWNYALFVGVWGLFVGIYLVASSWAPKLHFSIAVLVLDALSNIFWFSSFIALAVWLGAFTGGEGDSGVSGIQMLEAADVFGAFAWLTFVATLYMTLRRHRALGSTHVSSTAHPMQQTTPVRDGVAQHPGAQPGVQV